MESGGGEEDPEKWGRRAGWKVSSCLSGGCEGVEVLVGDSETGSVVMEGCAVSAAPDSSLIDSVG